MDRRCMAAARKLNTVSCVLTCLFLLNASSARADSSLEFSGYYKNMFSVVHLGPGYGDAGLDVDETIVDDYERIRLKLDLDIGESFEVRADYEARTVIGQSVGAWNDLSAALSSLGTIGMGVSRPRFMGLEHVLIDDDPFVARHGIDRLQARWIGDTVDLTIGRQSVSWGSTLFWTPTDIFAGFAPTEIDRDEKPGVDVVRLTLSTSDGGWVLDTVLEPLDMEDPWGIDAGDSTAATRLRTHVGEYDVSICAGYVASDWVAGGGFSGYLGNAGFRGDLLQTWVSGDIDDSYIRWVLGLDYSFGVKYQPYVLVEYYWNQRGGTDIPGYIRALAHESIQRAVRRGTLYSPGRQYIGASVILTLTALTGLQSQTIVNAEDGSVSEYLSLSRSLTENTDLIVGANRGLGPENTEFGGYTDETTGIEFDYPSTYFGYLKWYF